MARPACACLTVAISVSGCFLLPRLGQPPVPDQEVAEIIDYWLLCEECTEGERADVVGLGAAAVPRLTDALRAPAAQKQDNMRAQVTESFASMSAVSAAPPPMADYVDGFVANYVATYQRRSALALGDIATPDAIQALGTALDSAEARAYRPDVVAVIAEALDRAQEGSGWTDIGLGASFSCGVYHTGRGFCWGGYAAGQLGNGRVQGPDPGINAPDAMLGTLAFARLDGGTDHGCGVTPSSRVLCWGASVRGRLGIGPVASDTLPVPVEIAGPRMRLVVVGAAHACGLTTDGDAFCWGDDTDGQIGDGLLPSLDDFEPAPVAVGGGLKFRTLSAGALGNHTCGISFDGRGWCWGRNDQGQLGTGSSNDVATAPTAVAGGHTFAQISAGSRHSCGVTVAGTVLCWGANDSGQIGDPSGAAASTPRPVSGLPGGSFAAVAAGDAHTCAVATNGAALCWGSNDRGQLGSGVLGGTTATPVPVIGGHTWDRIDAAIHTCGTTVTGTAFCWGEGASGEIGNGDWELKVAPEPVIDPG